MRYVSALVGLLFGFIVVGSGQEVAAQSDDYSAWIAGCKDNPGSCVPVCQRDALYCAKQINGYLLTPPVGSVVPRFKTWPLYPGRPAARVNNFTPMHGSYLTIFVNEVAKTYIDKMQSDPNVQTVDFKNGSIIAKLNSAKMDMSNQDGPWLTVMFKLDGYCYGNDRGTGNCVGGDWFYYLYRKGDFHYFNKVPAVGKAKAFCIDCHDPVQKGDFLWTTFTDLLERQAPFVGVDDKGLPGDNLADKCEGLPIGPVVPGDVKLDPNSTKQAQLMFDCLSWRSFLALNWPAQGDRITDDGPRVWETYRSVFETFQPSNPDWTLDNQSWDDPEHFDPVCKQESINDKVLRMTGKQRYSEIIDEAHQAFGNQFNILIDQNGNLTHFEVRINRDEFEYLKKKHFADTGTYDVGGPKDLLYWGSDPLQFPDNIRGFTKTGAIEIKAAWREMCTDPGTDPLKCPKLDDLSHYFTRDATIYTPDPFGGEATCRTAKVGLVGFHIAHKTFWAPQWVWTTFEHVENVPVVDDFPFQGTDRKTKYSFYSPWMQNYAPGTTDCKKERPGVFEQMPVKPTGLTVAACPNLQNIVNSHPSGYKQPPYAVVSPSPNQVIRLDPISTTKLNHSYRTKLANMGSVFQYYVLVNTQWPLNGRGSGLSSGSIVKLKPCPGDETDDKCYNVKPDNLRLRNTTLETYQVSYHMPNVKTGMTGQASSFGCIQCHGVSGVDFSFVWTDAVTAPVPLKPVP